MSESPKQQRRTATRWLRRAAVITLAGIAAVGVALWPSAQSDPASAAQQTAAKALMRCSGQYCFGTLRYANAAICLALLGNGGETVFVGVDQCPGDTNFTTPAAAQRPLRFLACAVRERALDGWHAYPSPATPTTVCGVDLRFTRAQYPAWINRLDAATSTAFVQTRRTARTADLKRGGTELVSTWEGIDPADETDDSSTIDFSDPLDGGVP